MKFNRRNDKKTKLLCVNMAFIPKEIDFTQDYFKKTKRAWGQLKDEYGLESARSGKSVFNQDDALVKPRSDQSEDEDE